MTELPTREPEDDPLGWHCQAGGKGANWRQRRRAGRRSFVDESHHVVAIGAIEDSRNPRRIGRTGEGDRSNQNQCRNERKERGEPYRTECQPPPSRTRHSAHPPGFAFVHTQKKNARTLSEAEHRCQEKPAEHMSGVERRCPWSALVAIASTTSFPG